MVSTATPGLIGEGELVSIGIGETRILELVGAGAGGVRHIHVRDAAVRRLGPPLPVCRILPGTLLLGHSLPLGR